MLSTPTALAHFRQLTRQQQIDKMHTILSMLGGNKLFAKLWTFIRQHESSLTSSVLQSLYGFVMGLIERLHDKEVAFARAQNTLHKQRLQQAHQKDQNDISTIEHTLRTL